MKKISTKIALILVLAVVATSSLIGITSVFELISLKSELIKDQKETMFGDYDMNIKHQVDAAITVLDSVYKRYEKGELSLEEAKTQGANILRNMRYGKEGYFWADTLEGVNVVLLGKDVEGKNRYEDKDANGKYLIKEIIENGKKEDGGFSNYYFPKEGETKPLPKRAYSRLAKGFNWVVGTGNYIDTIESAINEKEIALEQKVKNRIMLFVVLALGVTVISVFVGIILGKRISKPILHITKLVNRTSDFDLTYDERFNNILQYKDEIGIIGKSVIDLRKQLREIFESLKIDSGKIKGNSEVLSESSQTTAESIEAVSKATEELVKGSVEQAKDSQNIAEMLSDFSDEMNDVVNSSDMVKDFSKKTEEVNLKGRDTMNLLNQKFDENRQALIKVGDSINSLSGKSTSIDKIVSKIQGIAEQTNLLSLNAAIEAARAGEAGKGFSVVASEIRKLSEQVELATRDISSEIEIIQHEIEKSKSSMNQGENIISEVNEAVEETQNIFNIIDESTKNSITQINNLYDKVIHASNNKDKILESVHSISLISEESAAGLEEVSASMNEQTKMADNTMDTAEDLKEIVENLNEIINKFKL
ncbi:MAG: methyl-accepting chemotaxis protein [Clostridium sp.]|nr:methyl-accepting chemotaxis protein [Clostridium sp.]